MQNMKLFYNLYCLYSGMMSLRKNIQECIKERYQQKERSLAKGGKSGRGSMVTFLYKNLNLLLQLISYKSYQD